MYSTNLSDGHTAVLDGWKCHGNSRNINIYPLWKAPKCKCFEINAKSKLFQTMFIIFRAFQGVLILVWDVWCVFNSKLRGVCVCVWDSMRLGEHYLVSRRKGVMFHLAFRLAVTPLGADVTR